MIIMKNIIKELLSKDRLGNVRPEDLGKSELDGTLHWQQRITDGRPRMKKDPVSIRLNSSLGMNCDNFMNYKFSD